MIKRIYLAGGCFWGTEQFFKLVRGVVATSVGYANGHLDDPSYEQVCAGDTGHAEAVCVDYDSEVITLERLLELYFKTIDPTSLNKQGGDTGEQYRTGIYYTDHSDEPIIRRALTELQGHYRAPLVVECLALSCYYLAEDYHQGYLEANPRGYCHIRPELFALARSL